MAAAARLLTARQSVKFVAMNLGYSRPGNFSRDFKRHFGRSPRNFAPRSLFGLTFAASSPGKERVLDGEVKV